MKDIQHNNAQATHVPSFVVIEQNTHCSRTRPTIFTVRAFRGVGFNFKINPKKHIKHIYGYSSPNECRYAAQIQAIQSTEVLRNEIAQPGL